MLRLWWSILSLFFHIYDSRFEEDYIGLSSVLFSLQFSSCYVSEFICTLVYGFLLARLLFAFVSSPSVFHVCVGVLCPDPPHVPSSCIPIWVSSLCVFESLCSCYFLFYFDSVSPCIQYSVHSVLLPLSRYLSLLCSHVPPLSLITLLCIYCVGFLVVPCQVICSYPPVSLFLCVSQFRLVISWVVWFVLLHST